MSGPPIGLERGTRSGLATWISLALGLTLVCRVGLARAEEVTRNAAETDDAFMIRALGGSVVLAQRVVTSTELVEGKTTLIGFAAADETAELFGHLLIPTTKERYQHVRFQSCEVDGDGTPTLLAVFFARTQKDASRDLGVLCTWDVSNMEVNGAFISAEFYRLRGGGGR